MIFQPNKNRIWMYTQRDVSNKKNGYCYFILQKDDADDFDEVFNHLMYDLVQAFSQGHVVMYQTMYKKLKYAKKKWFGRGWKPGKFNSKGATARLKQELVNSGWKDGIFADYYDFYDEKVLWSKTRRDSKCLCILQEKLDMDLFRKSDMTYEDDGCVGIGIKVFPQTQIQYQNNTDETVDYYCKTDDFLLDFGAEILSTKARIVLNEKYMTAEELIEKIKPVIEKHKKVLEVNL